MRALASVLWILTEPLTAPVYAEASPTTELIDLAVGIEEVDVILDTRLPTDPPPVSLLPTSEGCGKRAVIKSYSVISGDTEAVENVRIQDLYPQVALARHGEPGDRLLILAAKSNYFGQPRTPASGDGAEAVSDTTSECDAALNDFPGLIAINYRDIYTFSILESSTPVFFDAVQINLSEFDDMPTARLLGWQTSSGAVVLCAMSDACEQIEVRLRSSLPRPLSSRQPDFEAVQYLVDLESVSDYLNDLMQQ